MFRSFFLALFALPLAQAFMVTPGTTFQPSVARFASKEDIPSLAYEAEEFAGEEAPVLSGKFDTTKVTDFMSGAMKDLSTKAKGFTEDNKVKNIAATAQDLASKAKGFAEDEKVQEIATKAQDFAKDVLGQVFSKVGDKLKELKKEKELQNK